MSISNKFLRLLFVAGIMLGIIIPRSTTPVYAAAANQHEAGTIQPLINMPLQASIDGAVLVPSSGLYISENPAAAHDGLVFIYKCPAHTAGDLPPLSSLSPLERVTLRPPGNMARAGYIFMGWRNGSHIFQPWQTFYFTDLDLQVEPSFYFYAVWAAAVFLTLEPNGGIEAKRTIRRAAGEPVGRLPLPPSKDGYVFLGWFSTPEATGGGRLTAFSAVPGSNTTYWARWRAPLDIVIHYESLVNANTNLARSQANDALNQLKHLFSLNFGVTLSGRTNTARYEAALNQVGDSASDILGINPSDYATLIFRFVDFPLNGGEIAGRARPIRGMEGSRQMHLGDMVVTTTREPEMFLRAITHEISHLLGAHDCNNQGCVMDISRFHMIYDRWCTACRSDIHNFLYIRVQNNPHLIAER